jgi:hypothetical protein
VGHDETVTEDDVAHIASLCAATLDAAGFLAAHPEPAVEATVTLTEAEDVPWLLSLVLARYGYGESTWSALDPEERNAVAEPYLRAASLIAPMVTDALARRVAAPPSEADIAAVLADVGAPMLLPHEDWCCATGCTGMHGTECPGCQCVSGMADRALTARIAAAGKAENHG